MAKTDWSLNDIVTPSDLNQIGQEINEVSSEMIRTTKMYEPCDVSTANITSGLHDTGQDINGVIVQAGMRVFVQGEPSMPLPQRSHIGIYVASEGAWERASDMPEGHVVYKGELIPVLGGKYQGIYTVLHTGEIGVLEHPLVTDSPLQLVSKTDVGLSNVDNVQQAPLTHVGSGGTAHAVATTSVAGFMSSADKTIIDDATAEVTSNAIVKRDANGRFKAAAPAATDDVARLQNIMVPPYAVTSGTGTAYTATYTPAFTATTLIAGARVTVKIHLANTGSATLNINGLGAKSIRKSNGSVLSAGNLKLDSVYTMVYDGSFFILQGEGGEYGNAVATEVLTGKTIGTESGIVTGTMNNRTGHVTGQSVSRSGTTLRIRPQAGYYPGDAANSVQIADTDFIASNIRAEIDLFGLLGTLPERLFASGTTTVITSVIPFIRYLSSGFVTSNARYIHVTGLTFQPKIIIAWRTHTPSYNEFLNNFVLYKDSRFTEYQSSSYDTSEVKIVSAVSASIIEGVLYKLDGNAHVNGTSFRLPVASSGVDGSLSWFAFG